MIRVDNARMLASLSPLRAQLVALVADLGGRYKAELRLPQVLQTRLLRFALGTRRMPARDVLVVNGHARAHALERAAAKIRTTSTGKLSVLPMLQVAASALREVWVERLYSSGGDVRLAPLSASWRKAKRRRGLDPRIGIATGDMVRAVERSPVIVSRA